LRTKSGTVHGFANNLGYITTTRSGRCRGQKVPAGSGAKKVVRTEGKGR